MTKAFGFRTFAVMAAVSATLAFGGAAQAEETPLAVYSANSGPLPPQYYWSVEVTIAPSGKVELRRCKASEQNAENCETSEGQADPAAIEALLAAARASELADRPAAPAEQPMVGGPSTWGTVWLDGLGLELPAQAASADAERVGTVLAAIAAAVPADLQANLTKPE